MSNGHGSSRRQAYGRRMKDLRTRRGEEMAVDMEGPTDWNRGDAWDDERALRHPTMRADHVAGEARPG